MGLFSPLAPRRVDRARSTKSHQVFRPARYVSVTQCGGRNGAVERGRLDGLLRPVPARPLTRTITRSPGGDRYFARLARVGRGSPLILAVSHAWFDIVTTSPLGRE